MNPWHVPDAPLPRLASNLQADVCVIGLGAAGLAMVRTLQGRRVRRMVALDPVGVAADGASCDTGILLPSLGAGLGPAAPGTVVHEAQRRLLDRLGKREVRSVERRAVRLGSGTDLPADVGAVGALVHPVDRLQALADAAWGDDAWLYAGSQVTAVGDGVVTTSSGTVTAPNILVALDHETLALLPELGDRVRATHATAALIEGIGLDALPGPLVDGALRARRMPDGRVLATHEGGAVVVDALEAAVGVRGTVARTWSVPRMVTDDALPVVEKVRDGVYAVAGFGAEAHLLGVLFGEALAEDVSSRVRPEVLVALDAMRAG